MNFYDREQKRIVEDQLDNQRLEQFINKYSNLKSQFEIVQQQNGKLALEIKTLKETNQRMQQEISTLKGTKTNDSMDNTKENMRCDKSVNHFLQSAYLKAPSILNKTIERTYCVQQTKRKVINGFVDQLTQQLQQNQDLLKKQRKMQDQTRRTLQLCNQQLSILKSTIRNLQNQVTSLSLENQQLLTELQVMIRQKYLITEQLSANINENRKLKGVFMMNAQEFESQMLKMDGIYKNIEMELKVLE